MRYYLTPFCLLIFTEISLAQNSLEYYFQPDSLTTPKYCLYRDISGTNDINFIYRYRYDTLKNELIAHVYNDDRLVNVLIEKYGEHKSVLKKLMSVEAEDGQVDTVDIIYTNKTAFMFFDFTDQNRVSFNVKIPEKRFRKSLRHTYTYAYDKSKDIIVCIRNTRIVYRRFLILRCVEHTQLYMELERGVGITKQHLTTKRERWELIGIYDTLEECNK